MSVAGYPSVITARNASANNIAWRRATITRVVTSNHGSFTISGHTAITDASGIATFPARRIDGPGGYTMTAVSELGGSVSAKF
jgi:hypothetical protein